MDGKVVNNFLIKKQKREKVINKKGEELRDKR